MIRNTAMVLTWIVIGLAGWCANCRVDPSDLLDEGFMVRDGAELHPVAAPFEVIYDDTIVEQGFPETWPIRAANSWDAALARESCDESVVLFVSTCVAASGCPVASVGIGYTGDSYDEEVPGRTVLSYDESGHIVQCDITISSDLAYSRAYVSVALRHEFGHCLGLEDDLGPPTTVDLRSIMSDPLDPLGVPTQGDVERLLEWYYSL